MVEGPGCTLNGERLRARVARGQVVKSVRGTALRPSLHGGRTGAAALASPTRSATSKNLHLCNAVNCISDTLAKCKDAQFRAVPLLACKNICHPSVAHQTTKPSKAAPDMEPGHGFYLVSSILVDHMRKAFSGLTLSWGPLPTDTTVHVNGSLDVECDFEAFGNKVSCQDFLSVLIGCVYKGVRTLGKELFMYFGEQALRIHFGMNGSLCINSNASQERSGPPAVLEIQLTADLVCFYDATVELRNAAESEGKIRMLEDLDVCSPKFSFSRAESEIKKQTGRLLCDMLLDQTVLPGVGNIIKNEALFDSGLHPGVRACQLTDEQIHHLVKMIRDFTLLFYKCRQTGLALYKHYKVYKCSNCRQCRAKITVCRLGETSRMTYFCPQCQKDKPQLVDLGKLPTRNSLIGWAYSRGSCSNEQVAQKSEEEWGCAYCTLINKPSVKICDACLTPRSKVKKIQDDAVLTDLVKYPHNNFAKPRTEIKINRKTAFGTTTLVMTDFALLSCNGSESLSPDGSSPRGSSRNDYNSTCHYAVNTPVPISHQYNSLKPRVKKQKIDYSSSSVGDLTSRAPPVNMTDGSCTLKSGSPRCSKHRRFCILRVVRKDGENKGRQFYACPLPREARCDYFEWADLHFPFCNHGKRCIMRTVLKIGPNNGKNFFVCPLGKDKQCDFFLWAENGPGMKIIPGC